MKAEPLEELEHDGLTGQDLEQILISGRIVERQRDAKTGQRKYLVLVLTVFLA